jgi:hypothetical protein
MDLIEEEKKYRSPGIYGAGFNDIGSVCVLSPGQKYYLQLSVLYPVLCDKGVGGAEELCHASVR